MSAAAKAQAHIVHELSYISTTLTAYPERNIPPLYLKDIHIINLSFSWLSFYGGLYRRGLYNGSGKFLKDTLQYRPGDIAMQLHPADIFFAGRQEYLDYPCGPAEGDRQYAGNGRVKGSAVTGFAYIENSADQVSGIAGGNAGGFIQIHNTALYELFGCPVEGIPTKGRVCIGVLFNQHLPHYVLEWKAVGHF
jgi:hypothetical protein